MRPVGAFGAAVVCVVTVARCGAASSYDAVMDGLRGWLRAVEAGDPRACDRETPGMHAELLEEHPGLGGPGTSCADRVGRMGPLDLPAPDAAMTVPVWDPSGEAVVDVVDGRGDERTFWMQLVDGRWRVAGAAD